MNKRVYLSSPHMGGEEMKYIQEAFDTNWIAPLGENVDRFEQEIAGYVGVKSAAATVSGTAALHLAIKLCGAGRGDYVFCSSFTFLGSCDGIVYEGAEPVFIDSEPETLNMSPVALQAAFDWAIKEGKIPKAVIIVDLYGISADYDKLIPICKKYNVPVISDAAESLGAQYKGKKCGSFGDLAILSFNGNKIITTSGGGMLLSNSPDDTVKARFWSTQSREPALHYEHKEIGYNYRMSNISAGIGRGQLKVIAERLAKKKAINERYAAAFKDTALQTFQPLNGYSNYWLAIGLLESGAKVTYMDIINHLNELNIETRPLWKPMHLQPLFAGTKYFPHNDSDLSGEIFNRGICLPSDTKMTEAEQDLVINEIKQLI